MKFKIIAISRTSFYGQLKAETLALALYRLVIICVAGFTAVAHGEDQKVVKLCTTTWEPFTICNDTTLEASGTHATRVRQAFASIEQAVLIECMPWKRCLRSVETGAVDGVLAVSRHAERDAFLNYLSVPLQSMSYVFVTLKSTHSTWEKDQTLANLPQPIGSPFGWSVTERLRIEEPRLILDTASPDDDANMRKLMLGRIPTIVIEESVVKSLAEDHDAADKIAILMPSFTKRIDYYLAFGKNSKAVTGQPDLPKRIERSLQQNSQPALSAINSP